MTVQAINTAVSGAVDACKQDIGKFQQQLRTTRQQDEQRRITLPTQISDTIATIARIYQRQGIALSSDAALRAIDPDASALVAAAKNSRKTSKSASMKGTLSKLINSFNSCRIS
ncbi:MAG: hypothetical protein ACK4QL_08125 [Pseudanabaenaceae cyanobacterium]